MAKRLIIEPEAEADIADAYRWYEERRSGLGDDFVLCIEAPLHGSRSGHDPFQKFVRALAEF